MKRIATAVAAGLLLCGATACSSYNDHRGKGDAPAGKGDDTPARITNMPDGFPNLSVKCLKGDAPWAAVVTTDRGVILIQDPIACGAPGGNNRWWVTSNAAEGN